VLVILIYLGFAYVCGCIQLGPFKTEEEAARCYDCHTTLLWGIQARTNFPIMDLLGTGGDVKDLVEQALSSQAPEVVANEGGGDGEVPAGIMPPPPPVPVGDAIAKTRGAAAAVDSVKDEDWFVAPSPFEQDAGPDSDPEEGAAPQ
jgi:hypothetical protein